MRIYVYAAAALALIAAFLGYGHRQHAEGLKQGRAEVAAKWEADVRTRDVVAAKAVADAKTKADSDRTRNEEIVSEYVKQVSAITSARDDYRRLLVQARGQVSAQSTAEDSGTSCPAPASEDAGKGRIDELLAGALAEADANASQLNSLIAAMKGQL